MRFSASECLHLLSALSAIMPLLIGLRIKGALWYYVLLAGICDGLYFLKLSKSHPQWFGNLFLIGEFLLVNFYLISEVGKPIFKKWITVLSLVVTIGFVLYSINFGFLNVNYKGGAFLYGLLILPILYGFYFIMQSERIIRIEQSPLFIFCAGFLLYVAGSFMIMLFVSKLATTDKMLLKTLWVSVHDIVNILKNVSIAYCLHLYKTNRRQ